MLIVTKESNAVIKKVKENCSYSALHPTFQRQYQLIYLYALFWGFTYTYIQCLSPLTRSLFFI